MSDEKFDYEKAYLESQETCRAWYEKYEKLNKEYERASILHAREYADCKEECQEWKDKYEKLNEEHQKLAAVDMQQLLNHFSNEKSQLFDIISECKCDLEKKKEECQKWKEECRKSEDKYEDLQKECAVLKDQVEDWRAALKSWIKVCQKLEKQYQKLAVDQLQQEWKEEY